MQDDVRLWRSTKRIIHIACVVCCAPCQGFEWHDIDRGLVLTAYYCSDCGRGYGRDGDSKSWVPIEAGDDCGG